MALKTFIEAIRETLSEEMRRDRLSAPGTD